MSGYWLILIVPEILITVFYFLALCAVTDDDDASLIEIILPFNVKIYNNLKDKINLIGMIILETLFTIIVLPGIVVTLCMGIGQCIVCAFWAMFMHIFKKRR